MLYPLLICMLNIFFCQDHSSLCMAMRLASHNHHCHDSLLTSLLSQQDGVEGICFPEQLEQQQIQHAFYNYCHFPGVIGAIDCSHIPIKYPGGDHGQMFINRKGRSSINVQVILVTNQTTYHIATLHVHQKDAHGTYKV